MKLTIYKLIWVALLLMFFYSENIGQTAIPDIYRKGTITEQLSQIENHTKVYENFRAIREDIYQLIQNNVKDSMAKQLVKVRDLNVQIASLRQQIDSINKGLETTKTGLHEMTQKQNSISVLGLDINKTVYNSIMWSIIGIAVLLLLIGYFIFKKNMETTQKAKNELSDIQKEFEDYKQRKRIEIENMTMSHFNEIKRLKENFKI